MIYLDWAATSLIDPASVEVATVSYLTESQNPSALYQSGQKIAKRIQENRSKLAQALCCQPDQLYFCGSATEANNIVVTSFFNLQPASIITSPLEHAAVYHPLQRLKQHGWKIIEAPINSLGQIKREALPSLIEENTVALFAIAACNETGSIEAIKELSMLIATINQNRKRKIHFHSDMVQALGKEKIDLSTLKVDSASFSGHKIGAIRGGALLYLKKPLIPFYDGGGQEKGIRSGTENVGAIESLTFSTIKMIDSLPANQDRYLQLKKRLIEGIFDLKQKGEIYLLPTEDPTLLQNQQYFLPNLLQISIPPLPSEVLVRLFDSKGVELSGGSACSNNSKKKVMRIAQAMKYPDRIAKSTLRISFGPSSTIQEIEALLQIIENEIFPLAKKF